MHSRKQRVNEGYYESQNRSFQNSKYSSSGRYSNYYRDRDSSPPKRVAHRSVSPEGSPRDRYHQSSSYRSKDRDREYKKDKYSDKRGRDRDVDYKNYSKKAKTRERSSSEEEHKESDRLYDKARHGDRDSLRRAPPEKERRFGEWKEMISKGSGKKYYYNERDKSSQWEKPEDWVEYEMAKEYSSRGYREKERDRKPRDDRYNSSRRSYSNSKHSRGSSRVRWPHNESYPSTSTSLGHSRRDGDNADMDISPDSTPNSEPSYSSPTASANSSNIHNNNNNNLNHEDTAAASPSNGHVAPKHSNNQLHHQMSNASSGSSSRLLASSKQNSSATSSSPSTQHYAPYHSAHHHRHRSVSPEHNVDNNNSHHSSNSLRSSPTYGASNTAPATNNSVSRLELNNSNHMASDGPPTPEMDLNSSNDHRRLETTSGVSSLQSVMSASQTTNRSFNLLTPSLAKFFRPDLITHVTNWPAEILEKQAQKCTEEVYLIGDLECCRVSAEIQCARSIARVAEIAATIQGQRRLFLQEQIKEESQTNTSALSY